ncbi:type II toxin-antitoxin system RelE/ParE family toxin [Methylovirgula sp. 4M-Z18]|uniref:type II toxin-antitoxin system RelE/ParE family toxin n=1 Tax=Methylovirgula sp. 4M-Z18 TaxID=2293567 RepID=UPI000E2EB1D5|nr:type II toxin-antitoxin system RelE/ParE family toxin [Methylovirgula sp. 4M-Z18]RFB76691.1 type II toxin-antitoxin system RelE/ParE family toxin [Methylovirgula sp. 4M-Z18]
MIVEFSNESEINLERIAENIAQGSPRRALSFVRELRGKIRGFGAQPEGLSFGGPISGYGVDRRVHGHYLIFDRIEKERIVIVHV